MYKVYKARVEEDIQDAQKIEDDFNIGKLFSGIATCISHI
jgi:hypothetical protein